VQPRQARPKGPGPVQRFAAGVGQYGFQRSDGALARKLSAAGVRSANAVPVFVGVRTLVSFGPALFILLTRAGSDNPLMSSMWMAGIVWFLGHMLANAWLSRRSRIRVRTLTESLPDSLDLMVVCLESGLGLSATIARVGQERADMDDPLGFEFAQVAEELRAGRGREEALRALGQRNGVEDLKALTALIIQSDRLGASMAKTLRVHADMLRTKRRQRAEEAARKLPVKILFPLAVFLLPPIFIMVGGPAMLLLQDLVKIVAD
jgi:tight adherence protein C